MQQQENRCKKGGMRLTTHKITPAALELLRQVAQTTGEKQYRLLERLLRKEWERVQRKDGK